MHRLEVPEVFALREVDPKSHSPIPPTSAAARLLGHEPIKTHPTNTEKDPQTQVPWTQRCAEYLESQHLGKRQEDHCKSRASLGYRECSKLARATQQDSSQMEFSATQILQ